MGRKPSRLLIIRPGALGDTLLLLPTLIQMKDKISVSFVGRRPGIDFVREYADKTFDMDTSLWSRLFLQDPDPRGLPLPSHDQALVFMRDEEGTISRNLEAYLPGIDVHLHPSLPRPGEKTHAARHILECVRAEGLPIDPDAGMRLALDGAIFPSDPPSTTEGTRFVVHPGSGDLSKNHPPALWRDLLNALARTLHAGHARPVVLLGPAEEALRPFFLETRGPVRCEIHWCPGKDQLISLLRSASLYAGHDSGITHLAAMLGVPTMALFRASDPIQWRPLGPRVTVIEEEALCADPIGVILREAEAVTLEARMT